MADLKYRRILLKLGGEALAGEGGFGIDPDKATNIAQRVKEVYEMDVDVRPLETYTRFVEGM